MIAQYEEPTETLQQLSEQLEVQRMLQCAWAQGVAALLQLSAHRPVQAKCLMWHVCPAVTWSVSCESAQGLHVACASSSMMSGMAVGKPQVVPLQLHC